MRIFYEEWCLIFENRQLAIDDLGNPIIDSISSDNIRIEEFDTDKLSESDLSYFLNVSFTNHYIIISRTTILEERLYYIRRCATEFWKVETTKYYLKEDLYHKEGSIQQTNFARTAGTFQEGFAKYRGFEEVVVNLRKRILGDFYKFHV